MTTSITLQIHHDGTWHDAATVELRNSQGGIRSPSSCAYDMDYYFNSAAADFADGHRTDDHRALSINYPVDLEVRSRPHWPAFMLDYLPQGRARERLAKHIGETTPEAASFDIKLLLRTAGSPIGNVRVKEAWEEEQERLKQDRFEGLTTEQVLDRSDRFRDMAERYAYLASGSSGVQGEWPKILMTRAADGLWYPDPVVRDEEAREHTIVKMSKAERDVDQVILASEPSYLEVARLLGLRVALPLRFQGDTLMIPRFDREVEPAVQAEGLARNAVVRHGQESLASAIGAAEFGHLASHEQYISVLASRASDPRAEIVEYVKRDVLNWAMGNTDNHGRNTALQKRNDGWIGLTPLYDFAPMALDPRVIGRSTNWKCLRGKGFPIDWSVICSTVGDIAGDAELPARIAAELHGMADTVARLPRIARDAGVSQAVIDQALRGHGDVAEGLAALKSFMASGRP